MLVLTWVGMGCGVCAVTYLDRRLLGLVCSIIERGVKGPNLGIIGDIMDPLNNLQVCLADACKVSGVKADFG